MAGAGIKYTLDDAAVLAAMQDLQRRSEDMSPLMDAIGSALLDSVIARFETGTGPDGVPWEPSQRALARGDKTLVDTERLKESMTYVFGPDHVEVGTIQPYGGIHQFGGQAGRGHAVTLPPRPFLGISPEDEDSIEAAVLAYWREAIN